MMAKQTSRTPSRADRKGGKIDELRVGAAKAKPTLCRAEGRDGRVGEGTRHRVRRRADGIGCAGGGWTGLDSSTGPKKRL